MIQRPRIPAIATLLVVLIAGIFFLGALRKPGGADDAALAELQRKISAPDARPEVWIQYADKLREHGQHSRAAVAYKRVLEGDPYNKHARLQGALSLAAVGNADEYYSFLRATLVVDPRLTQSIMARPETAPFLAEGRYQTLQKEAVQQSLD